MFVYYFELALRSLRRNVVLTVLMVAAIGVGIGVSMTVFTVLNAMESDPIPDKSSQLFVPLLDNWGPEARLPGNDYQQDQLTYRDAIALRRARPSLRQTALYPVRLSVTPPALDAKPFSADGQVVYSNFFKMFEVPFRSGGEWSTSDDDARANVAVISGTLADRLFPTGNAVGNSISLDDRQYRVIGILKPWNPLPRYYDVVDGAFGTGTDVFIPFSTAIDRQMPSGGNVNCYGPRDAGWLGYLNSECIWIKYWVELPNIAAVQDYRQFLYNYAAEQQRSGRFHWTPHVDLRDVREWLVYKKIVPNELRISTLVAFGFLLVCLINAVGLMLAKFDSRGGELAVRRALGASKGNIFVQCLIEAAAVGLVGGILGLALTALGLSVERAILGRNAAQFAHLYSGMVLMTLVLAVVATVCSGLYPTWRASRVQPAWELKTQ